MALEKAQAIVFRALAEGWRPDPDLTVSAWADLHRILSSAGSAEPGKYRTARVPYLREIMDALSARSPVRRVVVMKGSQLGFTEIVNNAVGYVIHHSPGPILFVEPTGDIAKAESKQRLAPMIDECEALRERVRDPRSRDSGNTILVKEFPGGILVLSGANSPKALRRMPVRYLFLDEVDGYPGDVGEEGDPVALAEARTTNFPRRKVLLISTPTIKGESRIEREFLLSDQRRYFVPCPHCGHMDWIRWENIRYEDDRPQTAKLACMGCQQLIEERFKGVMLAQGEWRPTVEDTGRTRGYHLSALYSPLGWKSWADCVLQHLEAKDDPMKRKTWVNTVLGETWEERGAYVTAEGLAARCKSYFEEGVEADVPSGVGILVASVDVQDNWLEAQVKGYGAGEESWLIAHTQVHGDPGVEKTWLEMDEFLTQEFTHVSGQKMTIACTAVDSGGHHTDDVYKFCRARLARRVFAVRGGSEQGKPVVPDRPSIRNRYRTKLFTLCVDTAKDIILSRLKIGSPGPGYVHLPDWVDAEYLAQLTAEKAVRKWVKRRGTIREWVKLRERNEALDLEVYCLAALYIIGRGVIKTLPERAIQFAEPLAEEEAGAAPKPKKPPRLRTKRSGWVTGWKR